MDKVFINTRELSALISVPIWSIQKMVRERRLPAYSLNNRTYLFDLDEVIKIIEESKV